MRSLFSLIKLVKIKRGKKKAIGYHHPASDEIERLNFSGR